MGEARPIRKCDRSKQNARQQKWPFTVFRQYASARVFDYSKLHFMGKLSAHLEVRSGCGLEIHLDFVAQLAS